MTLTALSLRAALAVSTPTTVPVPPASPGGTGGVAAGGPPPTLPAVGRPPGAATAEADRILSAPPYTRSWFQRAVDRVLEAIGDAIGWLLERLPGVNLPAGGGGGGVGTVIVAVLVAALVVGVIVLAVRQRGSWTRRRRGPGVVVAAAERPEQHDWAARAAAAERDGRWREALRCRYRALMTDLDRWGAVDEVPGRTTGEERAELAVRLPAEAATVDALLGRFDEVWYGGDDASAADVRELVAGGDRLVAAARASTRASAAAPAAPAAPDAPGGGR